jgi:hypothetical protein
MSRSIVVAGRIAAILFLAGVALATSSKLVANRNRIVAEPGPVVETAGDRIDEVSPQVARDFGRTPQGRTSHYGVRSLRAILTADSLAVGASALVEVNETIPETLYWVVRILPQEALRPGADRDGLEPIAERQYLETPASPDRDFADLIPIDTPPLAPGTYAVQVALETIDGNRAAAATRRCSVE